ncbi:lactate racemase domain-containing protein [Alicyclobacillus macrosporangiidus]|uniref:lactate racemase domain-containing protein n=1 Tax=Alicyclobacillus macrosporangiidus TaxID=392015 RepID=UPI000497421F|nr:lactate racemase domain-containing protein [Alicyclobacillus macrosporangiidus]
MPILESGLDFESPVMVKVQQHFPADHMSRDEIYSSLRQQCADPRIRSKVKAGAKVAVAVGSRGIAELKFVVRTVIDWLKEQGTIPFIVPAMGSHGGGTSDGQRLVLEQYGITEDDMAVPIDASMDTVQLGVVDGAPVYFSKAAYHADLVVPICRVKPHTDFKGPIESGVFKMLSIGLGKHKGAAALHSLGFRAFPTLIPNVGQFIIDHAPIGFSVCIVENGYDDVATVQVVPAELTAEEEPKLLQLSKQLLPKINVDDIHLLIVDQIGKNISGEGMDPNITGRSPLPISHEGVPRIDRIAVLDLTEETHGNATGIGMADLTTVRCFRKIDLSTTYANVITAGLFNSAKIPVMLQNDREVIAVGLKSATTVEPPKARVVRIRDTLHLGEFWVSEVIAEELRHDHRFTVTNERKPFLFDEQGNLTW